MIARLVFGLPAASLPKFEAVRKKGVIIILKKRSQEFKRRAIKFFQPKQRGCRSRSISEHQCFNEFVGELAFRCIRLTIILIQA